MLVTGAIIVQTHVTNSITTPFRTNRTRTVESWPQCGGALCPPDLLESRGCLVTEVTNCEFTDWSVWTLCSNDCGAGVTRRSRSMITPAYCGGTCQDELMYEEEACESYTARQDCEVSEWSDWSSCIRNCEGGIEQRNRSLISDKVCGGRPCQNLTEIRSCHETCEQLCNAGVCDCKLGFHLNADNSTCTEITCPPPQLKYCPQTHTHLTDCRYPEFTCFSGHAFNHTCTGFCADDIWTLKGMPTEVTCREDGSWTQPLLYCVRPNKPPLGIDIDKTTIDESTPKGTCFAYLSTITSDDEKLESHIYIIITDSTKRFYIKENRVCLNRTANYEEKPDSWDVTFRSTDFEGEFIDETFTFDVLDANGPPSSVKLEPDVIPENSLPGTVVGCFVGFDDDPGQTLTFTLVNTLQKTFAAFEENGQTCLKVIQESNPLCEKDGGTYCILNRELHDEHRVTVRVTDDGSPPLSAMFDVPIYLSDVNDKQTTVKIYPEMIPENIAAGEPLVKLVTVDEDTNQRYTYQISNDPSGLFGIKGDNLIANRVFDYEKERDFLFELEVVSTDDATPPMVLVSVIKMKIGDMNESPFDLHLSSLNGVHPFGLNTPRVPENFKGTMGTVMVKDQDLEDYVEISIEGLNNEMDNLALSPTTCRNMMNQQFCTATINIVTPFNYEDDTKHMFSLTATDKAGKTAVLNITLDIINVNDPPYALLINGEQKEVNIPENKLNYILGELTVVDDDKADRHEVKLTEHAHGLFLVEGYLLKTSRTRQVDFERQNVHHLVVTVTDNGTPRQSADFNVTVRVVDVNEVPSSTVLSNAKINENSHEGTVVGTLITSDPDNLMEEKQHFQYTLSDDSLGRFQLKGNTLMVRKSPRLCGVSYCVLDYEAERSVTVIIVTVDDGEPRMHREDKFTIYIEDTNDPPTDVRIDASMIKENQLVGSLIGIYDSFFDWQGTLTAEDVDADSIIFELQNFVDVFDIQDGNRLVSTKPLDYEKLNYYRVTMVAKDDGVPQRSSEVSLVIRVVDVNEAPIILNVSEILTIKEDAEVGAPVVTWSISDPDSEEDIEITLTDHSNTFSTSSLTCETTLLTGATDCTVQLILMVPIFVADSFAVLLSVSDKEGLTISQAVQIQIQDVNVRPTDILLNDISTNELRVPENTRGTTVAVLRAVDKDPEQKHKFKLISDTRSQFEINGNELMAKMAADIDFETSLEEMKIEIEVEDDGEPPLSFRKTVTVIVEDINEAPSEAILSSNTISENSPTDTVIGQIAVTDPDVGQKHTVNLVNDGGGHFKLENYTLKTADVGEDCTNEYTRNCKLNYEENPVYTLTVQVLDSGLPPLLALFYIHIEVTDANDKPWNLGISSNKVLIGSPVETVIGYLNIEDEDKEQTHIFELLEPPLYVELSSSGIVTVSNRESLTVGQMIELRIKCTDNGTPPLSTEETIQVLVVGTTNALKVALEVVGNSLQIDEYSVEVQENTDVGIVFAKLVTEYSLTDRNIVTKIVSGAEVVQIQPLKCENLDSKTICEVELVVQYALNYEEINTFETTFETTTEDTKSIDSFRIYVKDINEAPMALSYSTGSISVSENSKNQLHGMFFVIDPDLNDNHVYSIADNNNFVITDDGKLFTLPDSAIDFESEESLLINVTVTDKGALSFTQEFYVTVTDVNETPTGLSISNNKIPEMGTEIGTLLVTDPDIGQNHTFEILSESSDLFIIEGTSLLVANDGSECKFRSSSLCLLDFESNAEYYVSVKVTDNGTNSLSAIFTIKIEVTDVNDPPRAISISANKISEDTEVGMKFAKIDAADDDINQSLTFNLKDNAFFELDGQNLVLLKALDFESATEHKIEVTVMDDGEPSMTVSALFTIDVVNVNEPPVNVILSSTSESPELFDDDEPVIEEDILPLKYIGQLVALDNDKDDIIYIDSVTSDVVVRNVKCIPVSKGTRCTADLRSGRVFDFEIEQSVKVTLVCTDKGGLQLKKELTLKISDTNDQPTNIFLNGTDTAVIKVPENSRSILLVTLSAEDREKDQSYSYSLIGESLSLLVTDNELWLTSAAVLDFETTLFIPFILKVTDSGTPPKYFQKDITLEIVDQNEAPTDLYLTSYTVPENESEGYTVGTFVVTDPDDIKTSYEKEFAFTLSNQENVFRVDQETLVVADPDFDYEKKKYFDVIVIVSDYGEPVLSSTFTLTIEITDVNEAPAFLEFSGDAVEENADVGHIVGKLSSRDPDDGQSFVYSILGLDSLSVDGDNVVVQGPLDYEFTQELQFTAIVTDNGTPPLSLEKTFTLPVVDINEPPKDIIVVENTAMTISEGSQIDEAVVKLMIIDEDLIDRIQLNITYGTDYFKLSPAGLICSVSKDHDFTGTVCTTSLHLNTILDYESGPKNVDVSLTAVDKSGMTIQRTFSFLITDVEEPPKDIHLERDVVYVPENTPNFVIGTIYTVDDDLYEKHTYIVVTPWEIFATIGNKLIAKSALNFEEQSTYTVTVRSQDNGKRPMFLVKEFEILVGDLNEKPSKIELRPTEVAKEAAVDEVIAQIHVTDPDNEGRIDFQTHTCQVTPSDFFEVDNSQLVLRVKSQIPEDVESIRVTVTCADSGEPPLSSDFNFNISVVENVNAPRQIQLVDFSGGTVLSVEENTANVSVGKIAVVNLLTKHPIQGTNEYSLSDNSEDLFEVEGDILRLMKELDFEVNPISYVDIFAISTDLSGNTVELARTFTIEIKDVNEPPTGVDINGIRSVNENVAQGTIIGDLISYDAENYQNYTYTLLGVNYGLSASEADVDMLDAFDVDGSVLKVGKEAPYINYEKSDIITLLINTKDSGEPPYAVNGLIRLVINDANDPPTDISISNSVIVENSPVDTIIGIFSVEDEDEEQQQACEILNLNDVPFKVLDDYQLAVARDILDYETQISYSVEVLCGDTVQDGTKLKLTKTFEINVTNINEAPTSLALSTYSIDENNNMGQNIAEIRVLDLDSEMVFLSIEDELDAVSFDIEGNSTLVARESFDFESRQFYKVTMKATDDLGQYIINNFEIEILDVNESPTNIHLDNQIVSENAEPGSIVGRFSALDPDWNQGFTYTMDQTTSKFDELEIIDSFLTVGNSGLDYETSSSHKIRITCTDDGIPARSIQQDFVIEIQDANDPPEAIVMSKIGPVPENAEINSILASFKVDDPDIGQRHACSVMKGGEFISIWTKADADAEMMLVKEFNYEVIDSLEIVLSCSDGEFNIRKELTLTVVDVNEAPTSIKLSGSNTVLADAPIDFVIGVLTADDEDFGQAHSFSISGQHIDILKISPDNELMLQEVIPLEYLENLDPSLKFTVTVADNGTPVLKYNQTLTLPITDVEIQVDSLPVVQFQVIELLSTMKIGHVLGHLVSENLTHSPSIQFTIVKNPFEAFMVSNNTFLVLANDVESLLVSRFEFEIQVEDVLTLETKTSRVSVLIQRDYSCVQSKQDCKENEICVEYNETVHACECIEDFDRNVDEICTRMNDCENRLGSDVTTIPKCLNGGICIDGVNNYSCKCSEGYDGTRCEIDKTSVSPCSTSLCVNEGICLSDEDGSSFRCSCKTGWTGLLCENSVDDCDNATCFNDGTCIDKHLTYLCKCGEGWKGLRCEYYSNVCNEQFCNKSHVCVGLVLTERTLCAEEEIYVVNLEFTKPDDTDISTFQSRLVDFIKRFGRVPVLAISTDRRKRALTQEEIQIYVSQAEETQDNYVFSFIVIDSTETPFIKNAVLDILVSTCQQINAKDLTEEIFCPSIIQSTVHGLTVRPKPSSNGGLIAGIIVTILFLLLLTAVIVFILKKKKNNVVKPEETNASVLGGSRVGYATMPRQQSNTLVPESAHPVNDVSVGDTPLTIQTHIIQVAPAEDDNAYTSVV